MYIPHSFKVNDNKELFAFCKSRSFGLVITNSSSGAPEISHVPFVINTDEKDEWTIEFHLAKANFQSQRFQESIVCGLQVSGTHGYISSSVYNHENVPTYNYESVYLTCESQLLSTTELEKHLEELVDLFEAQRHSPLTYKDFNRSLLNDYLTEIVGIRLKVIKKEGAFKLSQNRNKEDFDAIIKDNNTTNIDLCTAMLKHFPND